MQIIKELINLTGRVALITGGAGHLGRAFGDALAQLGASVALVDRNGSTVAQVSAEISGQWETACIGIECDLANENALRELPKEIDAKLGGIDILINNAGFVGTDKLAGWCVPFEQQTAETWRQVLEVNMTAPFFLTQAASPWLKKNSNGSVINIASIYAVLGPDMRLYDGTEMGNPAAYAASKGALIQETRWLAAVLAPDVRVNSICPGGIWRNQPEPFVERYKKRTPMARMGTEEDIIGSVIFLASDLSRYVTGQNIMVDGGWSVW